MYIGEVDYFLERKKIEIVIEELKKNKHVDEGSMLSWYEHYSAWVKSNSIRGELKIWLLIS